MVPTEPSNVLRNKIYNNKVKAEKVGTEIEQHNYSLGLLAQVDFMNTYADCFQNMNGYEVRTESCGGILITHETQKDMWRKYIEVMVRALKPQAHLNEFCPGQKLCAKTNIKMLSKKVDGGRVQQLDEFEKRDFTSNLMKNQYEAFEHYWHNLKFPQEAYVVTVVNIGDYDFDQQKFSFRFPHIGSLISPNVMGGIKNNILNSRGATVQTTYVPTLPFEQELKGKPGYGAMETKIDLPMSPDQARPLVQNKNTNRNYYAVTRIKFLERSVDKYQPLKLMNTLAYHYAINKIELYADEALTKKVVEVSLLPFTEKDSVTKDKASTSRYTLAKDSRLLDYRALCLLRFKEKDLLPKDMDQIAYSLSGNERGFWIKYKQRRDEAQKPVGSASNQSDQERLRNNKKRAEDRAKLSHFSWQDRDKLSAEQKKMFYTCILGYDEGQERVTRWPDAFPSVTWGMNVMTVFRKGYFSDAKKDQYKPVNDETKKIIQEFLSDVVHSQNFDQLTLVYGLDDLSYDEKNKTLMINQDKWSFVPFPNVNFNEGPNKKYTSPVSETVTRLQSRVLYPLGSSNRNVGAHNPDSQYGGCENNQKQKSVDCVTNYTAFTQLTFGNSYLALDKKIRVDNIPLAYKKGKNIRSRYYAGWRIVVELKNINMGVLSYDFMHPQTRKTQQNEEKILFADVQRVLILDPNDEIVWSRQGNELEDAEQMARQTSSSAQSSHSNSVQQANTMQSIIQCQNENLQKQSRFQTCQALRAQLPSAEVQLKAAEKNNCKLENAIKPVSSSEKKKLGAGPCTFPEDLDIKNLSDELKKCIAEHCGSPTIITQIAEYQTCAMKIQQEAQGLMQTLMTEMYAAQQAAIDTCMAPRQRVESIRNNLKASQCDLHVEQPVLKNCNEL